MTFNIDNIISQMENNIRKIYKNNKNIHIEKYKDKCKIYNLINEDCIDNIIYYFSYNNDYIFIKNIYEYLYIKKIYNENMKIIDIIICNNSNNTNKIYNYSDNKFKYLYTKNSKYSIYFEICKIYSLIHNRIIKYKYRYFDNNNVILDYFCSFNINLYYIKNKIYYRRVEKKLLNINKKFLFNNKIQCII